MPTGPHIGFRCTEELRNRFSGMVKQIGKTREEVLLPLVEAFLDDPGILEDLKPESEVIDTGKLTKQELRALTFMRNASKGGRAKMKQSVVRDFMKWIEVISELGD